MIVSIQRDNGIEELNTFKKALLSAVLNNNAYSYTHIFWVIIFHQEYCFVGVRIIAQWSTNPTRNHEVVGSIPALAQWVNDPALPWLRSCVAVALA